MPFVLDTSIVACWAFEDEEDPRAQLALRELRDDHALVPALWWFEVRNSLVMNERRKRIMESKSNVFLRHLSTLEIVVDFDPNETALLSLARSRRLSVYDAAYLELAARKRIALATLDRDLVRAARAEKVSLIGG